MHLKLGANRGKQGEAVEFINTALMDDNFVEWCGTWRTKGGEHPAVWLQGQLATFHDKTTHAPIGKGG